MSVWLTIPSARPASEANKVLANWRERGYKIALLLDSEAEAQDKICDLYGVAEEYPGYAQAVNGLVRTVMKHDPAAEWFVIGGDDTDPDKTHGAQTIARECSSHFHYHSRCTGRDCSSAATFGVMQPTGDRFSGGSIDRIAGSAWLGREFCERVNRGDGPLWPEYSHMFVDEELFCVANALGVYWARPDLTHLHHHFMRESDSIDSDAVRVSPPPHLVRWNSPDHWAQSSKVFRNRKAQGFPGHEPLAQVAA